MTCTLDTSKLPYWANDKNLYIFAGIELVARKYVGQSWVVKTSRCNLCGKCCMRKFKYDSDFPDIKDGKCLHLKPDGDKWVCSLGINRPFACSIAQGNFIEDCTEIFEELDVS